MPPAQRLEKLVDCVAPPAPKTKYNKAAVPKRHGGYLAAEAVKEQGVKCVYTLTGGHISPILVGCNAIGIKVVDVRDEVTTVFAADAYSRISGIPGVAIVTAGPGLTNTITAVKNAQMAESAVVVFGGATSMLLKGRGSLQDIDQFALMKPHCKWMTTIKRVADIIPSIRRAFKIAAQGVPGPVFVEFPLETIWPPETFMEMSGVPKNRPKFEFSKKGIQTLLTDSYIRFHFSRVYKNAFGGHAPLIDSAKYRSTFQPAQMRRIAKSLMQAKKPVIVIGSQAASAPLVQKLIQAVTHLNVPVYLSGMARGLMGGQHRLHMRHKRGLAMAAADWVLLCGAACDFRLDYGRGINSKAYFCMVNLCSTTLRKNRDMRGRDEAVYGCPGTFLLRLAEIMPSGSYPAWMKELEANQAKREAGIAKTALEAGKLKRFVHPVKACQIIDKYISDDSFLIADGGDFVGTASYIIRPRRPLRWLDPGAFGTLGCGAGFAIGAKSLSPSSEVWCLFGDGAVGWSLCEFDTMARLKLPVIAVIGNDACWSQMWRDQVKIMKDPVATELEYARYDKVCEALGGKGIVVDREEALGPALEQAKKWAHEGKPVIVNILLTKSTFRQGSLSI